MKINKLAVAATAFLHLKNPADGTYLFEDGQPVGIDLFSPGSPEFARVEERQSARVVASMNDNDGKYVPDAPDKRRVQAADDLAALTSAFRRIEHDGPDGTPLNGTALFTAVYADPTLGWIREQALKFVRDWGKFTPGSATS